MRYNIKLTLRAIARAERMMGKPFSLFDYGSEEDVRRLLYCCVLSNNPVTFTYAAFASIMDNDKQMARMIREMETANVLASQFCQPSHDGSGESGEGEPSYMGAVAARLIIAGMDASYVMNEMDISEIPMFAEAIGDKRREDMEAARLWTFISVAPHIDTRKIRSARDLMTFPWEEEAERMEAEEELRINGDTARRFLDGEFNPLKN